MELHVDTLVVAVILVAALIAQFALLLRWMRVFIPAAMERSRRRNRRESSSPPPVRRRESVPDEWSDDDRTDLHYLVELEREKQRARRSRGERPPRPGTHHDR